MRILKAGNDKTGLKDEQERQHILKDRMLAGGARIEKIEKLLEATVWPI